MSAPLRAKHVVLVAAGDGVGYLSGTSYLATFAASALLHQTLLSMGAVRERLVPLFMEDEGGGVHFADARALAAMW